MSRAVRAVVRYELAQLGRGRRWLPPVVLLAFALVTATAGSPPPGDALAFAGAALLPSCAWLTRVVLVGDPAAARACLVAAAGGLRTQVGCLVAALVAAGMLCLVTVLGVAGTVLAGSGADDPARFAGTVGSGLVSGATCAIIGVALGAVCNPPVLRRADAAVVAGGLGVTLALAASGSPAYAALSGLDRTPPQAPAVVAWTPLAVAVLLLMLGAGVSVWTAVRRGVR